MYISEEDTKNIIVIELKEHENMGYEIIQYDYYTLSLLHKLDEGKSDGLITVVLGEITDDLINALEKRDWSRLTNIKWRKVYGNTLEELIGELKMDELKINKLVEKHFNVKLTSTAMQVSSVKFINH